MLVYFTLREGLTVVWKYNSNLDQWKQHTVHPVSRLPMVTEDDGDLFIDFENFANSFLQQGELVSLSYL